MAVRCGQPVRVQEVVIERTEAGTARRLPQVLEALRGFRQGLQQRVRRRHRPQESQELIRRARRVALQRVPHQHHGRTGADTQGKPAWFGRRAALVDLGIGAAAGKPGQHGLLQPAQHTGHAVLRGQRSGLEVPLHQQATRVVQPRSRCGPLIALQGTQQQICLPCDHAAPPRGHSARQAATPRPALRGPPRQGARRCACTRRSPQAPPAHSNAQDRIA